jgi:hypothetical protein
VPPNVGSTGPITESGKELDVGLFEDTSSDEQKKLNTIEGRVDVLHQQIIKLRKYAGWTIVILALVAIVILFGR